MPRSELPDLDSQLRLVLAAKIDRLCQMGRREFRPEEHLPEVQEIIDALDPRVESSSQNIAYLRHKGTDAAVSGATEHGMASASMPERERNFEIGRIREYRIGSVVATKTTNLIPPRSTLRLDYYLERGTRGALQTQAPSTEIRYRSGDRQPVSVKKVFYVGIPIGPLSISTTVNRPMWRKKAFG